MSRQSRCGLEELSAQCAYSDIVTKLQEQDPTQAAQPKAYYTKEKEAANFFSSEVILSFIQIIN